MEYSSILNFLAFGKDNVNNAITNNLGDTHVVLGNEAADLDSVVSAVVYGYYIAHSLAKEEKENKVEGQQAFVFPVVNCAREDLSLRTEVLFFLKENNISVEKLICRDEIDLTALQCGGKLKLILVDHNVLAAGDAPLLPSVTQIIDHHKREKPLDRRDIIEQVGSCATLIAEIVLGLFDADPIVCRLLYGTIILDTINLSPTAKRATLKDRKMITELEESLSKSLGPRAVNRDEIHKSLVLAREDISQLSTEQLLKKDCKVLKTPEITIAIPAVPLLAQNFLELPRAIDALKASLRTNRCTTIVVVGYKVNLNNHDEIRRDIAVFADSMHKAKQICTPLESNQHLKLQLVRHTTEPQAVLWVYEQLNISLSRKFILPFLLSHLETKAQSQMDGDGLGGVDAYMLMPNGEMSPIKPANNGYNSVPSISYSTVNLGVGDPISQGGSSQSSAYNSCPYTPQNSCAEPEDGYPLEHYFLPSFNSREMIEKIELKRGKLRGYDDELKPFGACSSYPFTPKNSFVDNSLESVYEQQMKPTERQNSGINAIDSELLLRKLMEKRRGDAANSFSSTSSSKSQSLTKLNVDEASGGDMMNAQLSGAGAINPLTSPKSQTPPHVVFRSTEMPPTPTDSSD